MSKAARIRELIDGELTNREIAEQMDESIDYVRAVRGRYLRPEVEKRWRAEVASERSWWPTNRYWADDEYRDHTTQRNRRWRRAKYHADPEFRERQLARNRRWYHRQKENAPAGS